MKTSFYFVFVLLILASVMSCTNDSTEIKEGTLIPARFQAPLNNSTLQRGRTLEIDVNIADIDQVKKIKVFTKDTVIFEGSPQEKTLSFKINTKNWGIGTQQLSLETTTKKGEIRKDNRVVKVFPDVFPQDYTVEVIKVYPHATTSYTQGLEFDGDQLYEGTGGRDISTGRSIIAKVDLNTGKIQQEKALDHKYFGEGITILGDYLYQLTWQEHTCFVYDKNTLEEINTFTYTGEGWGFCNDGELLIMSDGSERIYFRDPKNFNVVKSIEVYSNLGPLKGINELEYIDGKIYANIYTTDQIVIIDPETGIVTGKIDASLLALDYRKTGEVLNGIAYKEDTKQLFITGKNWPNLLEVKLITE